MFTQKTGIFVATLFIIAAQQPRSPSVGRGLTNCGTLLSNKKEQTTDYMQQP